MGTGYINIEEPSSDVEIQLSDSSMSDKDIQGPKTNEQTEDKEEPNGCLYSLIANMSLHGSAPKKDSEKATKEASWKTVANCFSKLRVLENDPLQKHRVIIGQTMQVMLDLSTINQDNELLCAYLDEKNTELQSLKAQLEAYKPDASKNPTELN